jgi:hypothetical protein
MRHLFGLRAVPELIRLPIDAGYCCVPPPLKKSGGSAMMPTIIRMGNLAPSLTPSALVMERVTASDNSPTSMRPAVAVGGGGATEPCGGFLLLISDFLSPLVGCGWRLLVVSRTAWVLGMKAMPAGEARLNLMMSGNRC